MAYIKPTKLTIVGQGLTQSASSTTGISPITISVNTATTSTLGIVKVGSGLSITPDGVLSATSGGAGNGYTGSAGSTGTQGNVGFTGSTGAGYTGSAGSTGTVGYTGSRGVDGVTTTTTVAAVTTIIGTTSTTAGIPGFANKGYTGALNDAYTLSNGDLYVWKGGDTAGSTSTIIEYLIVAGGGAGAYGGGGGGGVLTTSGYVVSAGSPVSLSVGDGGVDANGGNSTFGSFTAIGGGRGGSSRASAGASGGSGGGASFDYGNAAGGAGAGTTGQGYRGGYGSSGGGDASAGGGGGAGGVGTGGYANGTNLASGSTGAGGGAGGIGLLSSISGTSTYYGGGGGGGANVNGGNIGNAAPGGLGGGGAGSTTASGTTQAGTEGTPNTGGGGGGGDPEVATSSFRRGGSGIVIIRYADTYPAASATTGSPTAVTTSGYRIYSWTTVGSGSITFATSSPITGQGWVLVGNIKGTSGYTGSASTATGYTGSIGFTGSAGAGYTGSAGSTGTQGSIGFTGSAGAGYTGSRGDAGYTGSVGSTGTQGNVGFTGSAGSTGTQGVIGYTGSRGIDGVTTTTTIAATIVGTTSTTAGIPGFSTKIYAGSLNDGYTLPDGDLYIWKGGDTPGAGPTVEYLVVAGGGAGGIVGGGGGGGGGVSTGTIAVSTGTVYAVTVGAGGTNQSTASYTSGVRGSAGGNSVFSSTTSTGGGGGGSYSATANSAVNIGGSGGSGGGSSSYDGGGTVATTGGAGTAGQGSNGGGGYIVGSNWVVGGGGGGASTTATSVTSSGQPTAGGAGVSSSITGSAVVYGGGGGGGGHAGSPAGSGAVGAGGAGGGGAGGSGSSTPGTAGTPNTGGGGGGSGYSGATPYTSGAGGSGIVVVRYPDSYSTATSTTGSPTAVTTSGYRIYSWTTVGSGSITFPAGATVTGRGWVFVGNIKGIPGEAAAIGYTGSAGSAGSTGPKITSVTVTDSSYNNLDDTAVALTGGYVKIAGSGFASGCQVLLGTTVATSVSYISSSEVRAQLPAASTGTYIIYLVNADGGTAIRVNAVTFSVTPAWTTGASLEGAADAAISIQLAATDATSYSIAAGSSLPSGISLSSGGLLSGTITGLSVDTTYNFTIVATDAELQDSTRAFTFAITVGEPYFKYVSLLLPGNGTNNAQNNTFLDRSTNNFTITRTGNIAQGTFSPYGSNWSYFNNGASSYLNFGNQTALHLGSGDFTIEMWLWKNANTTYMTACGDFATASSNTFQILGNDDGTKLGVYSGASNSFVITSVSAIPINTWTHVAFVRSGTTLTLYINGVSDVSATYSTNLNASTSFFIGHTPELNAGRYWNGHISNLRMVKGTAVYTGAFTPSTTPLTAISGTVLLTCQSNRFIDNSSNAFAVTVGGSPFIYRFSPFSPPVFYSTGTVGGSAYFDGSGDYLLNTGTTAGQLGSGDFTFECWYYPTNTTFGTGGANTAAGIFFDSRASAPDANGLSFYTMTNGTISIYTNGGVIFTTSNAVKAFAWNHIAFVRSGSTITGYINGVSGGTVTSSVNFSSGRLQISGPVDYSAGYIEIVGYVSDHRIVKGTAVYTTTFTPPTSPLTAITNTSLLLNYTNAGIIDNAMQNNLETVGDVKISTTQNKFGASSLYFDGTGDYCFIRNAQSFLFGSGNFTIELWAYISETSSRKYILGPGTDTASHFDGFGVEIFGQQLCVWASSNGTSWDMIECDTAGNRGATLLSANTWYHIAVTRSGNTFRTFVNGVVEKTYTSSAAIFSDATVPYNIGRTAYLSGTFYYNGYMDDLRVTRGYARYTATFTPPTSAHPLK